MPRHVWRAGGISELATSAAYVDSLRAADATKRFSKEAIILRHRLNALLGLVSDDTTFDVIPSDSARELEDAEAQLASAKTILETAQARLELLEKGELDKAIAGLSSLIIKSPVDGIVQEVHVAPGQTVTGTTALLEITGIDPVWIKVPVYVGDLATIDTKKPARVHSLADFAGAEIQTAELVVAPFSADPESITIDMFYELSNADHSYRPGQKVGVTLTLKDTEQSLVVPYSSILYDMYGSAWVYEKTEPRVYVRQRVELHYVLDELAVLIRGPDIGANVVTAGAAELFGTEFGEGK